MTNHPQTIQIFLPTGDPQGIRVAEITTRIVRMVEVPRSRLAEFLKMPEAEQVGVYFLFGEDEDSDVLKAYIGQTGSLKARLTQHNAGKEFWNRALVAVSLTNSLTNTHASYLEWLSIQQAQQAARFVLDNGNASGRPHTPAPLQAECAEIHDTVRVLLATLGYPLFEPLTKPSAMVESSSGPYYCRGPDTEGQGQYTEEGFVIRKGSLGRLETVPSFPANAQRIRERLVNQGVLTQQGPNLRFEADHLFKSPSGAACCLLGRRANGWVEWKDAQGRTLDELLRTEIEEADGE